MSIRRSKLAQLSCHLPTLKGAGSLPSGKAVRKTHVPKAQNLGSSATLVKLGCRQRRSLEAVSSKAAS
ncbi:MAG TPA: hypothetical protein VEP90_22045, partial [Methylomirabilota bacterium]|nr:hypothetical protein [Methylomirabilota bacterium]